MQVPLQVAFRHMDASPALEARIRQRAEELEQYCDRITACRVTVESQHRSHRQGNLFQVRIDLVVPRQEIAITRGRDGDHAHEDPYVAVRDAFDALRRRLEDHVREGRGTVTTTAVSPMEGTRG
jgi:ribosomal subunit interface protein